MKTSFPTKAPAPVLPFNDSEKAIVRRFGTKAQFVTYSGRDDLIGFKIVGFHSGFIVEAGPKERYVRILERDGVGGTWRTPRTLPLRYRDSLHDLVPGLWRWVR